MARPIAYDKNEVIAKLQNVFWKKGFAGTSISDLEEASGLKRTSLYAAFGDKQGIYQAALDMYKSNSRCFLNTMSEGDNPLENVKNQITQAVIKSYKDPEKKGCFFANASMERFNRCDHTTASVTENRKTLLKWYSTQLNLAKDQNLISHDLDTKRTASYLFNLLNGLTISLKNGATLNSLKADIRFAFERIEGI